MTQKAQATTASEGVELQISLTPSDLPHARWIVPHQLRCWGPQVDSIQLTVDLGRGAAADEAQQSARRQLYAFLEEVCQPHRSARVVEVDYSRATWTAITDAYFGGQRAIPSISFYGAFYAYFFGVFASSRRHILHTDSDMLYGGGSQSWVAEALETLARRPDVLACNPLPGPPTSDGELRSQRLERDTHERSAFRAHALSTRLFLLDTERLARITPIPLVRVGGLRALQCFIEGRSRILPAESCISAAMEGNGIWRLDFLGHPPGMWSIHPALRSATFYNTLPDVVRKVEQGEMPEQQRGRHDVDDSLVDWSDARQTPLLRMRRHADIVRWRAGKALASVRPRPRTRRE